MNSNPESWSTGVEVLSPEELAPLPDRIRERELTHLKVVRVDGMIVRLEPIHLRFKPKH